MTLHTCYYNSATSKCITCGRDLHDNTQLPSDKGPREWWIYDNGFVDKPVHEYKPDYHPEQYIHVIEYSAFEAMRKDVEFWKQTADSECETNLRNQKDRDKAFARVLQLELDNTGLKALARELVGVLEYQKTALRKICEGSMFTPESERKVAEDKIENVLTRAKSMGVLNE